MRSCLNLVDLWVTPASPALHCGLKPSTHPVSCPFSLMISGAHVVAHPTHSAIRQVPCLVMLPITAPGLAQRWYIYKSASSSSGRGIWAASCMVDLDLGRRKSGCGNEFLDVVSISHATHSRALIQESGCRRVSWRARGKASRSCSWTWRRCRSTGGSSCGGR
jgi:hypothetical protein